MELALGTVQFGLPYGIAGRSARVTDQEARRILEVAWAAGVRLLDTAPVYGDIEERLADLIDGRGFRIISKVAPVPESADAAAVAVHVEEGIGASRRRLGAALAGLLFHRAADLLDDNGADIWNVADAAARRHGIALGVSCYSPEELGDVRRRFAPTIAQMPGNALDQRAARAVESGALRGVELHLRSAFLQGLLLMEEGDVAARHPKALPAVRRWRGWCVTQGLEPLRAALCISKGMPGVTHVVVGVDSAAQMEEIVRVWDAARPMSAPELACSDVDVIDPRTWSKR